SARTSLPCASLFPFTTLVRSKALNGARGAIESDFTRMMGTSAEKVKALRASLDRLGKTMGMALTPQVGATSDKLRHLVDSVSLLDRKSTRLNSSHVKISYAVF